VPGRALTISIAEGLLTGASAEMPVLPAPSTPTSDATIQCSSSASSAMVSGQSDLTGSSYTRYFAGVARVGIQVAEALAYAHSMGMVHRDIKPSNLLLDTQGITWITDFGLVKDDSGTDLTIPGDIVGTIRYMAPERLDNQGDARSDIYSLGATLYEMLCLQPSFPGERRIELMDQVRHVEPRRPRQIDSRIPRDLETVVLKAMAKEPGRRYQTANAMTEDLRRYLADRPVLARRSTTAERAWRWCRRNPIVASLTSAVVVLLLVLLVGSRISNTRLHQQLDRAERAEGDAQRESRFAKESEQLAQRRLRGSYLAQARAGRFSGQAGQRFTGLDVLAKAAAIEPGMDLRNEAIACMGLPDLRVIEPDETAPSLEIVGAWGLEVSPQQDGAIVLTRKSGNEELSRLPSPAGPISLVRISPDGNWLAAYHNVAGHFTWVVWDWRRGRAVLQKSYAPGTPWGWSSDCTCFFYGGTDGLFHMHDLIQNVEIRAVSLQKTPWIASPDLYALSPDQRQLAIIGKAGSARSQAIVQVYDLKTGAPAAEFVHQDVPPHSSSVLRVAWDPDSRLLAAARLDGLYIWDVPQKKQHAYMNGVRGDVGLVFTRVGSLLVSSGTTTLSQVSDSLTGTPLVSIRGEFATSGLIADRLLPMYWPTSSGFFELAAGQERRTFHTAGRDFGPLAAFHPELPLLALADFKGVHLCDLSAMREAAFLDLGTCSTVLFHHQGDLLTYTPKYGLQRWPVRHEAGQAATIVVGPPRQLHQAPLTQAISASHCWATLGCGGQVAVADWGRGQAVLLNVDRPEEKTVFAPHEGARCVSVSPDGHWIASGPWLGKGIKVWDVKTAQLVQEFPAEWTAHAFFAPDGTRLIGCMDKEYRFWKVGSWELERVLIRKEPTYPGMVAFSPDGQLMALCESLAEVKLVECASGREIAQLPAQVGKSIGGLCFSPDGVQLAVTFGSGGAQLWDLRAVRRQLAGLNLDWDLPPYPPAPPARSPLKAVVVP
jgi:WD40 repeat protein